MRVHVLDKLEIQNRHGGSPRDILFNRVRGENQKTACVIKMLI